MQKRTLSSFLTLKKNAPFFSNSILYILYTVQALSRRGQQQLLPRKNNRYHRGYHGPELYHLLFVSWQGLQCTCCIHCNQLRQTIWIISIFYKQNLITIYICIQYSIEKKLWNNYKKRRPFSVFLYHQCKTKVTSPLPPLQKQWRSCWLMRYINLHDLPTYFNLFYLGVCDLPPPSRWLITEINLHQYCKTYSYLYP